MKKSIAIILICLLTQLVWGQGKTPFRLEKGLAEDAIFPGTIVVKLKSKSSHSINSSNSRRIRSGTSLTSPDVLNTEIKKLRAKEVRKVFKNSSSSLSRNGS